MRQVFIDDFDPRVGKDSPEWKHLMALMDAEPDLKATLFIIANNYEPKMTNQGLGSLNIAYHPKWCHWVDTLTDNPRIALGYHGCRHWNPELDNAMEFMTNDKGLIKERINSMEKLFSISLKNMDKYPKIFKIPGHKCNPYLFELLKERKYDYVSYHYSENHTDIMPVIVTDGKKIVNAHFGISSPTHFGRML
jgi:hypothetical protein